ncbi:SRPBCC family protein [Amycolatopsis sp. FDAARGOS 1241]|uniref:SRPBCC family protein n=1 Tax=Amycolatopsis sp. FDAARGOS 1241 TaxID=2778070 RepID=UPI001950AE2D|nr:SRPBCC family protein [Amycolatopsis sp. FDAARGOS 1241]QRP46330.1 SRPBCC family protein [Amycolatopsis sp. FDAARGOS 1241]
MDLSNTFTVDLPVEDAWRVLTDLERVAPCLPGAALLGVENGVYQGAVKIKVGPVSAKYQGTARFVEKDETAHRAVLRAEGKDAGGQGNAAATVTATLTAQGSGTTVDVRTDLALSGRVAQFGRGVIADVTGKLLGQFVQRLEAEVAGTVQRINGKPVNLDEVEPLDVMASVGGTVAKRALPVAAVALLLAVLAILVARKGKGTR